MQDYSLTLTSEASNTFRAIAAAQSQDIQVDKKLQHTFNVSADIKSDYNIGLIVGASGSGKTTLARQIYGDNFDASCLDLSRTVIDQFDERYSYDECAQYLLSIGLSSVPCWIRPAHTLSNGQRFRAEIALRLANSQHDTDVVVIDEWTSVVDRTVAKIMSHAVQKHARRYNKRIVLLSCHYDVIDWLNPDWIIDCNKQQYTDRRLLRHDFKRSEQLTFDVKEINSDSWRYFSKYHYLSDRLAGGGNYYFGLFHNNDQIGFQCFSNYTPWRDKSKPKIMHSNRTVVHPDYVGIGLGIKLINITSQIMCDKYNVRVMGKFSNKAVYESMRKQSNWILRTYQDTTTKAGANMERKSGFRQHVRTYSFEFTPQQKHSDNGK